MLNIVTTLVVVWIEITIEKANKAMDIVTTLVVVWIEIKRNTERTQN